MDEENYNEIKINKNRKIVYIILFILLIVILVIILKGVFKGNNKYYEMEKEMVDAAKMYVDKNNIKIENEMYLDIKLLGISLDGECSLSSGVIYDGKNFSPNLICNDYKSEIKIKTSEASNGEDDVEYLLVPNSKTIDNVTIILSVNDNNFDYLELPNREIKKEKNVNYEVSENGKYKFIIHEKNGDTKEKIIEVNNISINNFGSCVAKWKSDYTEITVKINEGISVINYEYIIDNKTELLSASNSVQSKVIKPTDVAVKIKMSNNEVDKIKCSIDEKTEPMIITSDSGKNCLEDHVCYVQFDYQSSKYPYCSMSDNPASCGGIGRNGCSITSASMAIANMGVKSKNGMLYNPFTVWEELYPFASKSQGTCWGGCSGWSRIRDSIINAGLSATKARSLNTLSFEEIINHLRKGYPIIVHAKEGAYAEKGHYMALIAVRDDNYVFLSDPSNKNGIEKRKIGGKQYYSDTWIELNDLVSGNVDNYMLVGPLGTF